MMRRGITLIELLITMTIIAIISAVILGTASAAFENARRSRTKTLVTKISGLLLEKYDSYATRRVDVHPDFDAAIEFSFAGASRGQAKQDVRLLALRELMRMEMPDRWLDVDAEPQFLAIRPSSTRYYQAIRISGKTTDQFQGAECLYMTVMQQTGDGEARTLFSSGEIGDVDNDGAREFVDGWGKPISFVRWPSHFVRGFRMTRDAEKDHDPFDIYQRDAPNSVAPNGEYKFPPNYAPTRNVPGIMNHAQSPAVKLRDVGGAFRLIPLVYSAGADDSYDVNTVNEASQLDPYDPQAPVGATGDFDEDGDDGSIDNIHNHDSTF